MKVADSGNTVSKTHIYWKYVFFQSSNLNVLRTKGQAWAIQINGMIDGSVILILSKSHFYVPV
jgi:hypothetical protein